MDNISEKCFDLAVGLYAQPDVNKANANKILWMVRGLEGHLHVAQTRIAVLEKIQEAAISVLNHARSTAMSAEWMSILAERLTKLELTLGDKRETNQ